MARPTTLSCFLAAALGLALASSPTPASAGGTQKRSLSGFGDFDAGETEGAAIEKTGRITVGFHPERGDVEGTAAFSCLPAGKHMLVGTSDKARILKVFPGKFKAKRRKDKKTKKGKAKDKKAKGTLKVEKLAELKGVVVSAMTSLKGGDVLAATLPGGVIHRVSARGKVSKFAELDVDQIWAMRVHKGRLLVATGPKGELFSLNLKGKDPKVVLDVDEKDLLTILTIGDDVVVGTSPRAKLFQVTDELEGSLLHDFPGDEVRDLTLTRTGLLAAVNEFDNRKISSLDALTKTLNRTSLTGQPPTGGMTEMRPPDADASLYHVDLGKGRDLARAVEAPWEKWLEREKQYFTSMLALDDVGTVLVASSQGGKVYRVRGPRDISTIADLEERQTTALCRLPKGPIFASTAHGAGVYQLRAAPASTARYRTKVFDADQPANYGSIVMRGAGPLTLRARSGPTEEPDRRWTPWRPVKLTRDKSEFRGSLSKLEHRRYMQVEVILGSPSAEVRALDLFFAPENLPPLLTSVDIDRPSFKAEDDKEPSSNVTIKWKVDARDDDDLLYKVRIRPEGGGETEWIPLNKKDELVTKRELRWDITTVPDGVYEVEVSASDEPSNGSSGARTDELVSAPFVVDRTRPVLSGAKIDKDRIRVSATDTGGYIHDAAFSIDGGPFRTASAADGLFDSPDEELVVRLPDDLDAGSHRIVLRARDSFGNLGSIAVVIKR